jgi:predicted unusual protein kinase regulating ubiquinone biosynthesis (AarF/ABC1/UbiB family)
VAGLSAFQRKAAAARIMTRVSEAYGEMMLTEGLFQADAHPGNILVMPGARRSQRARRPSVLSPVVLGGCSALVW